MRKRIFFYLLLLFPLSLMAQLGGNYTYDFLSLTNSARVAALGGKNVSLKDHDLNMAFHNPALLDSLTSDNLVLNYVNYFADVNFGYVSYAKHLSQGTFGLGVHYINYGDFIEADANGSILGGFKAAEYALNIMYAFRLDSFFHVGVNIKPVYSVLEKYTSFGMATDLGITYINRSGLFSAGFVIRNLGTQFKPYHSGNFEPVPLDISMGLTQKLRYAPLRFSVTAHHLQRWDMTYTDPNEQERNFDPFTGEAEKENRVEDFAENLMRHMIFGVELLPFNNFYLSMGYNYQRRKELQTTDRPGPVGFSWGFGLKISKFHISYGRASYHLAGGSNHFSLSTNLSSFYSKAH